jgi:putative membrane protein
MEEALVPDTQTGVGLQLAWMNTILGLQRTLMSAERTAVTLIAFGFTVAQLFQNLKSEIPTNFLVLGPHVPRDVGLLMVAAGVGSLALFIWEYLKAVEYLSASEFAPIAVPRKMPLHQLTCTTAYAIIALGILAFGSVFVSF